MSPDAAEFPANWGFTGSEDAAEYLTDVRRLWAAWVAGLAVLVADHLLVFIVGAVVVLSLLVWLVRPIQRRAAELAAETVQQDGEHVAGSEDEVRNQAVKDLSYGAAPLEAAIELSGQSRVWLVVRWVVIAATFGAFFVVITQTFAG